MDVSDGTFRDPILLLARISHELTVCARSTYEAGTERVSEPEMLRRYNELQHRVTGSLRDHLLTRGGIPVNEIITMVQEFAVQFRRGEVPWLLSDVLPAPS